MTKKLKHISMLALLAVAVQGAWGQTTFELGRPLYRDGDWNTLCLPFSMTKTQIDNSPLAGTIIKELYTGSVSNTYATGLYDGTLYLNFKDASSIVAGTPYIVKWFTIKTQDDWDAFAENVDKYDGKIVQLATDDIKVNAGNMVGDSDKPFKGIFDGGGHTIHCEINYTSNPGAAPFGYIYNATIMNVKVTGTVIGGSHCAGLVGLADGINTIKNCEVAATVKTSSTNCGGILGHGQSSTTTISNCLFSGNIIGNESTEVGVIYGWAANLSTGIHKIENCMAKGTYTSYGTIDMMLRDGTVASLTATNCYQNIASTDKMGTYFSSYSASDLVSNLGSEWQVVSDEAVPKTTTISNITSPKFENEPTTNTTTDIPFTGGTFKGKFAELDIDDSNRNEILLFAAGNKLGYANTNRTLKAYSAYFEIPTTKGAQAVRSFVLDFGDEDSTLRIMDAEADSSLFTHHSSLSGWYTLDGLRLDGKPTTKGIYVNNGKKVVIK